MKPQRIKKLILIGAISLITVLVWVAFDGYHQLIKQEQLEKVSDLIEPLNPRLDGKILEQIETRKEYSLTEAEKALLPVVSPTSTASLEEGLIGERNGSKEVATQAGTQPQ